MKFSMLLTALLFCFTLFARSGNTPAPKDRIYLGVQLPADFHKDSLTIETASIKFVELPLLWQKHTSIIHQGRAAWYFKPAGNIIYINTASFLKKPKSAWLAEPNDSIVIAYDGNQVRFSGRGSDKYELQYKIAMMHAQFQGPGHFATINADEYRAYAKTSMVQLEASMQVVENYKRRLSPYMYQLLKARAILHIDEQLQELFTRLRFGAEKYGTSNKQLCELFDSTLLHPLFAWARALPETMGEGSQSLVRTMVYRRFGFDIAHVDSVKDNNPNKIFLYWDMGSKLYTGETLEKYRVYMLKAKAIGDLGFCLETRRLLDRYFATPGFKEYKDHMRTHVARTLKLQTGSLAPGFTLTGINGKPFTSNDIKGKVVVMDFWFTGCAGCVQMVPVLKKVEETFKDNPNILFLSICTDEDAAQWEKSIGLKKYTTGGGINLYTCGRGVQHDMIKTYTIRGYPAVVLIDKDGAIMQYPFKDPRNDNGAEMIAMIKRNLALLDDGPYVWHMKDSVQIGYIVSKKPRLFTAPKQGLQVTASTHDGEKFTIRVKNANSIAPAIYPAAEKLFCLSDIEGNFDRLVALLQNNYIIDSNYNWTFGKGHLVFAGDMFDRGQQVAECLWLLYSLEEKAGSAGGAVHFILGNHEIMNLQGDHHYTNGKYETSAQLLNKSTGELYNGDSELGRWLRSKNIVEKIGRLLFLHGGISETIAGAGLSIEQMNQLARPWYDKKKDSYGDANTDAVMHTSAGPFWYRGYYKDSKPQLVESVLNNYGVDHIVTGHTIVADTISTHYNNKVINTDTRHATGNSEALLIEGTKYYRVNDKGQRWILFDEAEKK